MGKSAPDAPDYRGAAEEQGQASKELTQYQTYANRPDQYTPWGSSTWQNLAPPGSNTPQWEQRITLGGQQQKALDDQMAIQAGVSGVAKGLLGQVGNQFGTPMDWNNLPTPASTPQVPGFYGQNLPSMGQTPQSTIPAGGPLARAGMRGMMGGNQFSQIGQYGSVPGQGGMMGSPGEGYAQKAGDAIYNQATSRLDPRYEQASGALENKLYNQGLRPGDEAYDTAMQNFERDKTDAYQQAQYGATMGAGAEGSRLFGMDLSSQQAQQGLQGAQFQQAQALRGEAGDIAGGQFDQQMRLASMADQQRRQLGQEQLAFGGQGFNQQMQAAAFQNTQRQAAVAEEMQRRGMGINEINALLYGQQVQTPGMPSFMGATKSETPNFLGAAQSQGSYALDKFSADQAMMQSVLSGASNVGGAYLGRP